MTPEIEESKRRLYALATNPRMRAALDRGFALLARLPPPDEPEVREVRQNREANRLLSDCLAKRPRESAEPKTG
jgi:hypothetical protein